VITGVDHGGVTVGVLRNQHRTPKSDLLVADLFSQRIEVPAGPLEVLLAATRTSACSWLMAVCVSYVATPNGERARSQILVRPRIGEQGGQSPRLRKTNASRHSESTPPNMIHPRQRACA
jgi:hypothetical protein